MSINSVESVRKIIEKFNVQFLNYKSKQELKQMEHQDLVEYCIYLQNKVIELENKLLSKPSINTNNHNNNNDKDVFCKEDKENENKKTFEQIEKDVNKSNKFINKLFTNPINFFKFHD